MAAALAISASCAPLCSLRGHDAVGKDKAIADGGSERGERRQQRLDYGTTSAYRNATVAPTVQTTEKPRNSRRLWWV